MAYNMSIFTSLFFLCIGPSCRPIVPGRPGRAGLAQHAGGGAQARPGGRAGPARARPPSGRAVLGPGRRASGLLAIYNCGGGNL